MNTHAASGQAAGGPVGASAKVNTATALKIVASVVAVVGAVSGLFYFSAAPGMEYYKYVDEVTSKRDEMRGKRLKVHGYVVEGSIFKKKDSLDYKFKLETRPPRAPAVIEAEYRGLVPDNFKPGAEVVAKGTLAEGDKLMVVKDGIDAKCPSKYEAGAPKLEPGKTNIGNPVAKPRRQRSVAAIAVGPVRRAVRVAEPVDHLQAAGPQGRVQRGQHADELGADGHEQELTRR